MLNDLNIHSLSLILLGVGSWFWLFGVDLAGLRGTHVNEHIYITISIMLPTIGILQALFGKHALTSAVISKLGLALCLMALLYVSLLLLYIYWKFG